MHKVAYSRLQIVASFYILILYSPDPQYLIFEDESFGTPTNLFEVEVVPANDSPADRILVNKSTGVAEIRLIE